MTATAGQPTAPSAVRAVRAACYYPPMLKIESEREEDGRWIAEFMALPGVVAYGATEAEAGAKATALALRVIADRLDHGEPLPPAVPLTLFL